MTTFCNFTLKIKLELKRLSSPFRKLEMPMILLRMYGLVIFG